jgi:hypothetical protein
MSVVFCIAIVFRREEILSYGGDAGGCGCEEGGEVGCHCGVAHRWAVDISLCNDYSIDLFIQPLIGDEATVSRYRMKGLDVSCGCEGISCAGRG